MHKLGAGRSDVVGLNFGGEQVVRVKRSILLQFAGSMLASMFSGRYEDQLDWDEHGNVFLDYSAGIMMPLVEFLRLRRDVGGAEQVPVPEIEGQKQEAWMAMLTFFGLKDALYPTSTTAFRGVHLDVKIADLQ